jgi:type IV pilus assembly protein PilM
MASVNAVWGIDIGQCALKALRLQSAADGTVEITHFDLIEHPKILSQPDAETDQLIQNALEKFLSRNEIGKAKVAVAVPGQSSFARFVKLPPVEPKRIPEIVKFEAVQQIPFDIDEVEWDYQTFMSPTSPEVEVGIFAMRKELVLKHISYLRQAGIEPDVVQLAPLSLFNMMTFDGLTAKQGATILIDVGAENTDLVISDGDRIWLRSIPLGGNSFTDSLVKAFKLTFSKAETFKRTAATNKYARQIFVAMRPVFSDLVSEVQRSIGFYTSLHRDAEITRVLCLGNAFRLPGLEKYLGQNLQVETVRPNTFNRLKPSPMVNAPAFAENLWSFGVAYGLGVQALGLAPISSNLLPFSIARQRHWRAERWWFGAAAGALVLSLGMSCRWAVVHKEHAKEVQEAGQNAAEPALGTFRTLVKDKTDLINRRGAEEDEIRDIKKLVQFRTIMPQVSYLVQNAIPNDWRAEAIKQVAAAKTGKDESKLDFAGDVWPVLGNPEYAGPDGLLTKQNSYIYLADQVVVSLHPTRESAENWRKSGPQTSPGPGMTSPLPAGGVISDGMNAPMAPAGVTPGGGPQAGGPGGPGNPGGEMNQPAGRSGVQQQGSGSARFVRVDINGYTNVPVRMRVTDIQERLLKAINDRFLDNNGTASTDPLIKNLALVERLDVNKVVTFLDMQKEPPCWPPVVPPASGPTPADPSKFGPAPVAGAPIAYPISNFSIHVVMQIIQPAGGSPEQPARPAGRSQL